MKTIKSTLILLVTLGFFMSCSSDDDSPNASPPSATYMSSNIVASFFQAGSAGAPTVNWNGDTGIFSLTDSIEGLSIDSNTGMLSWTKVLPAGTHDLEIVVSNSAGETVNNITITNPIYGSFMGTYDPAEPLSMSFYTNGTVTLRDDSMTPVQTFTGTWTIDGNQVLINAINDLSSDPFSFKGPLIITSTTVTYSGYIYNNYDAIPGNEIVTFTTTRVS